MVDAFDYHESETGPEYDREQDEIYGLELEISDYDAEDALDALEGDYIITTPWNEGDTDDRLFLEYDTSVAWELIFKADYQRQVLRKLKEITPELNQRTVCNSHGTSAHVHINREWLRNEGVSQLDVVKAGEFMLPINYLISGRDWGAFDHWASSNLSCEPDSPLFERCHEIDMLTNPSYDRYSAINIDNDHTIENRIFSNYHNFNYDRIKIFLESTKEIVNLAKFMQGKTYEEHYEDALTELNSFYFDNRRRRKFFRDNANLDNILISREDGMRLSAHRVWDNIETKINDYRSCAEHLDNNEQLIRIIRILRDADIRGSLGISDEIRITPDPDITNIEQLLRSLYERKYGDYL